MKRGIIICFWLLACQVIYAQISDKQYLKEQSVITSGLQADINNTKAIEKAIVDIANYGDANQCFWLAQQLASIDISALTQVSAYQYFMWARQLVEHMMSVEPEFLALADGRSPNKLYYPYFYPTLGNDGQLSEMLSVILDIASFIDFKQKSEKAAQWQSVLDEQWGFRSHFIERSLYGDDHYSTQVLGTSMNKESLNALVHFFGSDDFVSTPFFLLNKIASLSPDDQDKLLELFSEVFQFGQYYMSQIDFNYVIVQIGTIALQRGKYAELTATKIKCIKEFFPVTYRNAQGYLDVALTNDMEGSDVIMSFVQLKQNLLDKGKEFVQYSPFSCPMELRNDSLFESYADLYIRVGYMLAQEMNIFGVMNYVKRNNTSLRGILEMMGYSDTRYETGVLLSLYYCDLIEYTRYVYENTQASWAVGAITLETNILLQLLDVCHIDDVYYELMRQIPFYYAALSDEKYVKRILDEYLLPGLPSFNLRSRDKWANCYWMEFYATILPYFCIYDEPKRGELEKFYSQKLEKALKVNKCEQNADYMYALINFYYHKYDTVHVNKWLNEYYTLTKDSDTYYLYKMATAADIYDNYHTAALYCDSINRHDSTLAASWMNYNGIITATYYAYTGQREKTKQQINVFKTFIHKQFSKQLFSIGAENAGNLLTRYDSINTYLFHVAKDTIDADLKALFVSEWYDWQLFSKGLLLALNTESKTMLQNHPSSEVRRLYNQLLKYEAELELQTDKNSFEATMISSNIDVTRNHLQQKMQSYMDEHGATTLNSTVWPEICRSLQEDEVAVEFVSAKQNSDSTMYCALLLRKNSKYPELIPLFEEKEALALWNMDTERRTNDMYSVDFDGPQFSQLVWSKLLPYIKKGETVYFAATGILHQLAIEALPYDENHSMADMFNLVRVSSTREIVTRHDHSDNTTAVLYGGIQYDVTADTLLAQSQQYATMSLLASRGIDNDTTNRGTVDYLPGTKIEADSIQQILEKSNVQVQLFTSTNANEESFKALSGTHQNILHIGTHGFFWTDSTAQKKDYFSQRMIGMDNTMSAPPTIDPLNRCGLLFAGANLAMQGHSAELPEGVQDGILTAKEISLLDLRDADLVVLSACETGKGEITGDGVFGLQRAFKMAGARTIIMSLWPVSDQATQLFMTEFFRHWITDGLPKREAFRKAQNQVRQIYGEPIYWAGFIMLD